MRKQYTTLNDLLNEIKGITLDKFVPNVKRFEEFNTLPSLCRELVKLLDIERAHGRLEPYCGAALASAMMNLCKQLAVFHSKRKENEEAEELFNILVDYISGAKPFIRLNAAYRLSNQLQGFMNEYPDPANIEVSEEALEDITDSEFTDESECDFCDEDEFEGDPYGVAPVFDEDDDPYAWYNEPLGYLFDDEKSFREFELRRTEHYAQRLEEEKRREAESGFLFPGLNKLSDEQIRFAAPFAREYFLVKAIDFCSWDIEDLFDADAFDFPDRDFSPEARREIEARSTDGFVKLYGMIASDTGLDDCIRFVNNALRDFEEKVVRRCAKS